MEIDINLRNLQEWNQYKSQNTEVNSKQEIDKLVEAIQSNGIFCPFYNKNVKSSEIEPIEDNYRESILYRGLNSRLRAVVFTLLSISNNNRNISIYSPEAVTSFALAMRGRYPKYLGSEYSENRDIIKNLFPIPIENIHNLSFEDNSFDYVIANEIFEHLPYLDDALSEIFRILKSSGVLISTFPFAMESEHSICKAKIIDGEIQYLQEPEYHGNPVDKDGSLVYEIPGWDIISRVRSTGYNDVYMKFKVSTHYGIVGTHHAGIFVLVAQK